MSVLPVGFGSSGGIDVGDIGHSLRLRAAASAYLSRTPGSAGNRKTWTWSGWVKRGLLGSVRNPLLDLGTASSDTATFAMGFWNTTTNDTFFIGGGSTNWRISTPLYRDPTIHYHVVVVVDTTQATAGNRIKVYINGAEITSWATNNAPGLNADTAVNQNAVTHLIGKHDGTSDYLDGYLSRICFVDGQALTPSSFGETNSTINEWVSKTQAEVKAVVNAGGTNSFMLDFDDAASLTTLGYDKSSKGNNWTLTNVSLTAGVTYDHMLDVPGNSYATLNPLATPSIGGTLSEANLKYAGAASYTASVVRGSLGFPVGQGLWYWETTAVDGGGSQFQGSGICQDNATTGGAPFANAWGYEWTSRRYRLYNSTETDEAASDLNALDVICHAYDAAAGKLWMRRNNGSWYNGAGDPAAGTSPSISSIPTTTQMFPYVQLYSRTHQINFGQRPFAYTPPTGFEALCQANLPDVDADLLDPTDHHIEILVTKSGNTNFTIPWNADTYDTFFEIKRRDAAGDWYQIDGLRGYTKILKSNGTAAETTDANVLGISGTTGTLKSTLADGTYVVSCTKAGLTASRQTNTDGSITSTVSRNVGSGFAIVTYTGTGVAATVGHGLGVAPKLIIMKNRIDAAAYWPVYHASAFVSSTDCNILYLNRTDAQADDTNVLGNPATINTTVFSVGTYNGSNKSAEAHVAYCYADSAIQKSFSYTGNGSADGPYAHLGFKCGRVFEKMISGADSWQVQDSARTSYNQGTSRLYLNTSAAEDSSGAYDITALGFKPRGNDSALNASSSTYIGHAWAAVTGKYSNAR